MHKHLVHIHMYMSKDKYPIHCLCIELMMSMSFIETISMQFKHVAAFDKFVTHTCIDLRIREFIHI